MSDAKITALTELTTPVDTDLLAIVDDPSGSAVTKKITRGNLSLLKQATVTLDNDQIKTNSGLGTLTTVVSAAGSGKILRPVAASLFSHVVSGYTNIGTPAQNSYIALYAGVSTVALFENRQFTGSGATGTLTPVNDLLESTGDYCALQWLSPEFGYVAGTVRDATIPDPLEVQSRVYVVSSDDLEGEPIVLEIFGGAGAFMSGHASNTLTISVLYGVLNVTTGVFE